MFFLRKDSIIYNFKKYENRMFKNCFLAVKKAKNKNIHIILIKMSLIKFIKVFRLCNF